MTRQTAEPLEHTNLSAAPLTLLQWRFDQSGTFWAEISGDMLDHSTMQRVPARAVLDAYAAAIGTNVEEKPADETGVRSLSLIGRIGPDALLDWPGRTPIILSAQVRDEDPGPEG